jgi:hypothetical protein
VLSKRRLSSALDEAYFAMAKARIEGLRQRANELTAKGLGPASAGERLETLQRSLLLVEESRALLEQIRLRLEAQHGSSRHSAQRKAMSNERISTRPLA